MDSFLTKNNWCSVLYLIEQPKFELSAPVELSPTKITGKYFKCLLEINIRYRNFEWCWPIVRFALRPLPIIVGQSKDA